MKRAYSGLETSVTDHHNQSRSSTYKTSDRISPPYRSRSEQVIAGILTNDNIPFGYEDELRVPREYGGGSGDRIWHPDFHLHDSGIIVEYAGMPHDEEYMKGIGRKKEVYEQLGVTVVWLYPKDLWEPTVNHKYGKLRDDAEENVLTKIDEVVRESGKYGGRER